MDVILLERVEKLGQMGDEVKVKDGFARNFLLPKKKALRSTRANREYFQTQKAQLEASKRHTVTIAPREQAWRGPHTTGVAGGYSFLPSVRPRPRTRAQEGGCASPGRYAPPPG